MAEQTIEAHRVTKPIQLLAAWLTGLVLVDGGFLTASKFLTTPEWLPTLLAIAAVVNVPLFLICIFILQTKFRPEMQEDPFYAKYLEYRHITMEKQKERENALKKELEAKASELQALQNNVELEKERENANMNVDVTSRIQQQRKELEDSIASLKNQISQVQNAQKEFPPIAYVRELNLIDKEGKIRALLTTFIDDAPNLFFFGKDGYEAGKDADFSIALGLDDDGEAGLDFRSKKRGTGAGLYVDDDGRVSLKLDSMGSHNHNTISASLFEGEASFSIYTQKPHSHISIRLSEDGSPCLFINKDGKQIWSLP